MRTGGGSPSSRTMASRTGFAGHLMPCEILKPKQISQISKTSQRNAIGPKPMHKLEGSQLTIVVPKEGEKLSHQKLMSQR